MKNCIIDKIKIWIVVTLAVIVAGMFVLGFVGFNNTVDYKESYQVVIDVEEDLNDSIKIAKVEAEKFFTQKGLASKSYATQTLDTGVVIYKFADDVSDKIDGLEDQIQDALNQKGLMFEVSVKTEKAYPSSNGFDFNLLLAGGIALVALFIYLCIMEKASGALSVLGASIIALLTFVSLVAIVRVPASPFVTAMMIASALLSAVLSSFMLGRFRNETRSVANEKVANIDIAKKVSNDSALTMIITLGAIVVSTIALVVVGTGYLKLLGIQILIAGVSAVFASSVWTPAIWSVVRKAKKAKKTTADEE